MEIKVSVKLTADEVESIVASAYSGVRYWARPSIVHGVRTALLVNDAVDALPGQSLCRVDPYKLAYRVNHTDFERGFALALEAGAAGRLTEVDSVVADRIVQFAIFGKVVYA